MKLILLRQFLLLVMLVFLPLAAFSQTGAIQGQIFDGETNEPVPFANIWLPNQNTGTTCDFDGIFLLTDLSTGNHDILVSSIAYQDTLIRNLTINSQQIIQQNISLMPSVLTLAEIEVIVSPLSKKETSTVSVRTLSPNELKYNAGASLDISQALKALPGINTGQGFSNELQVRGGSSNENAFFVEGIPLFKISHFAAQGSAGGFKSLLNLDLIKSSKVMTSGFTSNRGEAISGVFDFFLKEGNQKNIKTNLLLSSNDLAISAEGPLSKRVTFIASARLAYLQMMMNLLKIPYASNYTDWNYKIKWNIDERRKLTAIGIGGRDKIVSLFKNVHDDITTFQYENLRPLRQSYTGTGIKYNQLNQSGFTNIILSHNFNKDNSKKYYKSSGSLSESLISAFNSQQAEWRISVDQHWRKGNFNGALGGFLSQMTYQSGVLVPLETIDYQSNLGFQKYSLYAQASQRLFNRYLLLTLGMRIDGNNFSAPMKNPFKQFSPRFSAAYELNGTTTLNFNTGLYYQMPELVSLGYQNNNNQLTNKDLTYFSAFHLVGGIEKKINALDADISVELFFKKYNNYPFWLEKNTSLVNQTGGFSRKGFTDLNSTGKGRTYGGEFFYQQPLISNVYGAIAYTLLWSQSEEKETIIPSINDSRHNLSIRFGKHLKNNWHVGLKWQFLSGYPYSPLDSIASSLVAVHGTNLSLNIADYAQVNTQRIPSTSTVDIRIDKTFPLKNGQLEFFLDVSNVLQNKIHLAPFLFVKRDGDNQPIVNPTNPLFYETYPLDHLLNTFLPTLGIKLAYQ